MRGKEGNKELSGSHYAGETKLEIVRSSPALRHYQFLSLRQLQHHHIAKPNKLGYWVTDFYALSYLLFQLETCCLFFFSKPAYNPKLMYLDKKSLITKLPDTASPI